MKLHQLTEAKKVVETGHKHVDALAELYALIGAETLKKRTPPWNKLQMPAAAAETAIQTAVKCFKDQRFSTSAPFVKAVEANISAWRHAQGPLASDPVFSALYDAFASVGHMRNVAEYGQLVGTIAEDIGLMRANLRFASADKQEEATLLFKLLDIKV